MAAAGGNSGEEDHAAAEVAAGLEFSCKYCDRKFKNRHALGGHQNAHRIERAMDWTVKRRRGSFMDYYYPFSPFFGFPALAAAAAGGGQVNYWSQAASMPPYFQPGNPVPSPEIPAARPPHYVENHPPLAQVLPPPAITFPVGSSVSTNSPPVTPMLAGSIIDINSNPGNTPEIIEDGEEEVDLNLRL